MFFRTHWWNGKQKVRWFLLSWSVVSDFLHPHGLQDTGFPCSLLSPEVCSTSCSLSHSMPSNHLILCHPLLLLPSIFPSIRVFTNLSKLFPSGGQSIGASASVLPVNVQGSVPLGLIGLITLLSKRLSKVFSNTTVQNHQFFSTQPSLWSSSHIRT